MYCIVDPETNKIHRATFSKSLSEWIVKTYAPHMEVRRLRYKLGKVLPPGESSSGLYGIISTKKEITLRVSMSKDHAELLTECESRYVRELFLEPL